MNLEEYEKDHFPTYKAFAERVGYVLEQALRTAKNLSTPQSIHFRAKSINSLRQRLTEAGKLDTQTLEHDRRDLAGVRLIFYTNNDVDKFIASSLIRDNFEIEEDSTRIHHPVAKDGGVRYRAIHYTVRFGEKRTSLPEYAAYTGLRCEIQVQTILNHAWSETSHDILYKNSLGDGYGGAAMEGIIRRFEQIMDDYLVPAGHAIQKAQQDYERILRGKELSDKDIAHQLSNAQDNNVRYEILSELKDYTIPYFDDPSAAYKSLQDSLLSAVKAARTSPPTPISTTFGNTAGVPADLVTALVVQIAERLAYSDVVGTLELLVDIYQDEPEDKIRAQIENAVKNLAAYNIDAYRQVGSTLQTALAEYLLEMNDTEVENIRPIAIIIWTEILRPELSGTVWDAETVTLSRTEVPISSELVTLRDKAIQALFATYDRTSNHEQKLSVLSALETATLVPTMGSYSNELLAVTLTNATQIVEFMSKRAKTEHYELLQHIEHQFFIEYSRAQDLIVDPENQFNCQTEAKALTTAILKFRDTINADEGFRRYKVLVGFNSVYPYRWKNEDPSYEEEEDYRRKESNLFINEISEENESDWLELIERCAETKSNDLATFPMFGSFINRLSEHKPEIAAKFLANASVDLRKFLPGFLNGLAVSNRSDIYAATLDNEIESAKNLNGLVRHFRYSDIEKPEVADRLLSRAIESSDAEAVIECLIFVLEHWGTAKFTDSDKFLRDALSFLNDRADARWASEVAHANKPQKVYEEISPQRASQILENLGHARDVNRQVQRILRQIAEYHLEAVWDYFGSRLTKEHNERKSEGGDRGNRFVAVPHSIKGLETVLSKDPKLAIRKCLLWFEQDQTLFQYRAGRLLRNVFPDYPQELGNALADLIAAGDEEKIDFVLSILQNYNGLTATHDTLKEIVTLFPNNNKFMSRVRLCIDSTGIVSGELGFANAWRKKQQSLSDWLKDERPTVREFAQKHIDQLEIRISSELRNVEIEREKRAINNNDPEYYHG